MPPEIRENIWTDVLGNNLIHLQYIWAYEVDIEPSQRLCDNAWKHIVCQVDCNESKPSKEYKHKVYRYDDSEDDDEDQEKYFVGPHYECSPDYDHPPPDETPIQFDDHETMRLTVLRASSQIYLEANRVLWTTNTFSVTDADTLNHFMATRSMKQKKMIKHLRLEMGWYFEESQEWNRVLKMPLVRSLSGLRHLRLHVTYQLEASLYELMKPHNFLKMTRFTEGLRKFAVLPLTDVEVYIRDPPFPTEERLWENSDRQEVIDGLRKMLLGEEYYPVNNFKPDAPFKIKT